MYDLKFWCFEVILLVFGNITYVHCIFINIKYLVVDYFTSTKY